MAKKENHQSNTPMSVCFEKFEAYATPRNITLYPATYGFYEVRRKGTKKVLGAVKAQNADHVSGWVINWADKQRKFVADGDKDVIVGKIVSRDDCFKARHPQKQCRTKPKITEAD